MFVPASRGRPRAARGRPVDAAGARAGRRARRRAPTGSRRRARASMRCGGCDWMHLSPRRSARARRDHVRARCPRRGASRRSPSHDAPPRSGTAPRAAPRARDGRPRLVRACTRRGTHDPVEVDTCAVLDPALERGARARSPRSSTARTGGRGAARARRAEGRPVLELRWERALPAALRQDRGDGRERRPGRRAQYGRRACAPAPHRRPHAVDGRAPTARRCARARRASRRRRTRERGARRAASPRSSRRRARGRRDARVVELYAGAGNFTVLLARSTWAPGRASSRAAEACEAARVNLAARGSLARAGRRGGRRRRSRPSRRPPRRARPRRARGARAAAERARDASRRHAKHVVYVACDPQTLARDSPSSRAAYEPVSRHRAFADVPADEPRRVGRRPGARDAHGDGRPGRGLRAMRPAASRSASRATTAHIRRRPVRQRLAARGPSTRIDGGRRGARSARSSSSPARRAAGAGAEPRKAFEPG